MVPIAEKRGVTGRSNLGSGSLYKFPGFKPSRSPPTINLVHSSLLLTSPYSLIVFILFISCIRISYPFSYIHIVHHGRPSVYRSIPPRNPSGFSPHRSHQCKFRQSSSNFGFSSLILFLSSFSGNDSISSGFIAIICCYPTTTCYCSPLHPRNHFRGYYRHRIPDKSHQDREAARYYQLH